MKINKEGFVEKTNKEIVDRYKDLYPGPTPLNAPWMFDPLNPPDGWVWDHEWEHWVKK